MYAIYLSGRYQPLPLSYVVDEEVNTVSDIVR